MGDRESKRERGVVPIVFMDPIGLMESDPNAHVLLCADRNHLDRLSESIQQTASTEPCHVCGEKPVFRGCPVVCPVCGGGDTICRMCGGDKGRNVYVVTVPRARSSRPQDMTRDEFRQSVREAWGDLLSHLDAVTDAARQLVLLLIERADLSEDKVCTLSVLAGRACQTADAVGCLLREGHPDAAFGLSRVLQETVINALAIHYDGRDDIAERFREWSFGSIFRAHSQLVQLGMPEVGDAEHCRMEETYRSLIEKYGEGFKRDQGWIGNNVAERAKSVGKGTTGSSTLPRARLSMRVPTR